MPTLPAACVSAMAKPSEDWSRLRLTERVEEAVWRCGRKAQSDAGRQIGTARIVARIFEILLG